ncbi:MAG: ATP-dependent sacrificial sulfur transferase LarE [Deltaproteobacteria bacterium]|nr:MAG: ATP-dependent sacrificial sulfur transferase LarE [Deltaproteobacteria bacterium]UCH07885.1 MAG: ATP-dependent sacrificial sulfur transferase LarE [Deltaproteobacteria bacterium]
MGGLRTDGAVKKVDVKTSTDSIQGKSQNLEHILLDMESVLIAFSGGVDSTLLLRVAKDVLGTKVLAVTASSAVYPAEEIEQAKALAQNLQSRHQVIETRELTNPKFVSNPKDRCYWCKKELFAELTSIARENNLNCVVDGSNLDDLDDFRPGMKAARELGVRSPLQEAMLTKADIRSLSKRMGLPTWSKPSLACLASRLPYGTRITMEKLVRIDRAEHFLKDLGFTHVRVRHHDTIARIEVPEKDIPRLVSEKPKSQILSYFKTLGYSYVTVDLEGYRTGSLNEVLTENGKQ